VTKGGGGCKVVVVRLSLCVSTFGVSMGARVLSGQNPKVNNAQGSDGP
jgi:hypothetical protein